MVSGFGIPGSAATTFLKTGKGCEDTRVIDYRFVIDLLRLAQHQSESCH